MRRWACTVVIAGACVAVPAAMAAEAVGAGKAAGVAAGAAPAAIHGDKVLIEGKLYSPQALFIVTRRAETFGRDAIVPQYLEVRPDAAFLPYRLRADRLGTAAAATDSGIAAPGTAR